MKELEEKILCDCRIINNDIIKVDSFINHQIDPKIFKDFAVHVKKHFKDFKIDKILTIETSGIAVAYAVASELGDLPLLFAKKTKSAITTDDVYSTEIKSFTRNVFNNVIVSKRYLKEGENVLIVDDFLAEGNAALGLINLCKQAKANVVGVTVMIEKGFQGGRKKVNELGIKVYSGAIIKEFKDNKPVF